MNTEKINHNEHPMTNSQSSMGRRFTMELFFYLFLSVFEGLIGQGLRCVSESKDGCCTNYRLEESGCQPCIGTFGDNCTGGPCQDGYYGFGCLSRCSCSTQQQCDVIKGCTSAGDVNATQVVGTNGDKDAIDKIIPVIFGVLFSFGSLLVVITLVFRQRVVSMRTYLSGLHSSQIVNNSTAENSSDSEEDYSQMARASNNYNILSFSRRFRAISTVNATDEEDIYDETGATETASNAVRNGHDTYVQLALSHNHVLPVIRDSKEEDVCKGNQIVDNHATNADENSYVTLVPHSSSAKNTRKS